MMLRCACPACRSLCEVNESLRGRKVRCPTCSQVFAVDAALVPDAPAAAPPPEPAVPPKPVDLPTPLPPLVEVVDDPVKPPPRRALRRESARARGVPWVPLAVGGGALAVLVLIGVGAAVFGVALVPRSSGTTFTTVRPPAATMMTPAEGVADDGDWGRPAGRPVAPTPLPRPEERENALGGAPWRVQDLVVTPITLEPDRLAGPLQWDADGGHFFALEANGVLRRIRFADLRETHRLEIGQPCSGLAVSAFGLLVALPKEGEVWQINPARLTVDARIRVPDVRDVFASAQNGVAVARMNMGGYLSLIDLQSGTVRRVPAGAEDPKVVPALSADGRQLFLVFASLTPRAGSRTLNRFRLGRGFLTRTGFQPLPDGGPAAVCLSPDGQFVCVAGVGRWAEPGELITPVFRCDNLADAGRALRLSPAARAVAFDPVTEEIYAQDGDHLLLRFGRTGDRPRAYEFPDRSETGGVVGQLLVHPSGGKLIRVAADRLDRIEIAPPGRSPPGTDYPGGRRRP
jgi:hypothetical protein